MAEQAFLQIRVDAALKDDATDVLERIGMDMPNAIRMFLKRIVLEGGLPFEAKFPVPEQVEERPISENEKCVMYIPAKPSYRVNMEEYIDMLCRVPRGRITRREDIEKALMQKYQVERITINMHSLSRNPMWEGIPIWREVSTRGMLIESRLMSREMQKQNLQVHYPLL